MFRKYKQPSTVCKGILREQYTTMEHISPTCSTHSALRCAGIWYLCAVMHVRLVCHVLRLPSLDRHLVHAACPLAGLLEVLRLIEEWVLLLLELLLLLLLLLSLLLSLLLLSLLLSLRFKCQLPPDNVDVGRNVVCSARSARIRSSIRICAHAEAKAS